VVPGRVFLGHPAHQSPNLGEKVPDDASLSAGYSSIEVIGLNSPDVDIWVSGVLVVGDGVEAASIDELSSSLAKSVPFS